MAAFNLENNIREKLENRELKPSPDAWKKLESQLDKKSPKKKTVGWYYLVASVLAILIASSVFLNNGTEKVDNKIVKENVHEKDEVLEVKSQIVSEIMIPSEERIFSDETKAEKQPKQNTEKLKPQPPQKESAIDKKIKKSEALATLPKEEIPTLEEDKIFNAKVDEVVASVKSLQNRNDEITAEEVETLLNNARRDIQTQRILSSSKVDATALLQEVEWELEKSFRDKVFDALGEGFNKIRTAISQRND